MAILTDTGWSYDNSSGLAVTYGEAVEITAGQARIYIKSPDGSTFKVIGTGIGGGFGWSALPGSITASDTACLSTGSAIYGFGVSQLDLSDFGSFMVIYSGSALVTKIGAAGSLAFFVHLNTWQKIKLGAVAMSPAGIMGILVTLTEAFKAVCCFAGSEYTTPNAGVDVTGTAYWITSTDAV